MINMIKKLFNHPVYVSLAFIALGIFSLSFALISQYGFGYHPCALCIYQRWPYGIIIGLGLFALISHERGAKNLSALFIALSGLTMLIGMGIAIFHVGVEQRWWEGLSSCGAPSFIQNATSIEELEALINAAPITSCTDVAWTLFGFSMAAYNVLLSLGTAIYGFIAAIMIKRS